MTHPDLESARLKLDRAREHIQGFQTAKELWLKKHGQPFRIGLKPHSEPNQILGFLRSVDPPPAFLSTILGDVIHNARSALDHITWQLVQHGNSPNLTRKQAKQIQFPIYNTLPDFDSNLIRRMRGVLSVHEAIVRRYQPYSLGSAAPDHPFARMQGLSDDDKHRNIHIPYWGTSKLEVEAPETPMGCDVYEIVALFDLYSPFEVNAPLFLMTVGNRDLCLDMKVQTKVSLGVMFEDGVWVQNTISYIERMATDLFLEIDRVL